MKKLIVFLGFLLAASFLVAQNIKPVEFQNRRWSGNLAIGASVLNPNYAIHELFKDYGYTDTEEDWFLDQEYPQKYTLPSLQVEFAYLLASQMEIGGAFMVSHGNIRGYDGTLQEKLEVSNTNFRFTPSVKLFTKTYNGHFQLGPSLNIGEFYRTGLDYRAVPMTTRYVRIGLMSGIGCSAFETSRSFFRISLNYHLLPEKVAIGPFGYIENPEAPSKFQIISTMIPKEKILIQEIVIKAVYGFRFRTN